MPQITMRLLGAPRIEMNGNPLAIERQKALALLIYLHVAGDVHTRDTLATLLWADSEQRMARASLRRDLSVLNKALDGNSLYIDRESVSLSDENIHSDVKQFRQIFSDCHQANTLVCLDQLETAVSIYQGDFLSGFSVRNSPAFDEWQAYESENLRQNLLTILRKLTDTHRTNHAYPKALHFARKWLSLDPLDETAHASVMQLYALDGQHSAVERQYQLYVEMSRDELGLDPSSDVKKLYYELMSRQTPTSPTSFTSPIKPHNLPHQTSEFIGRSQLVTDIIQRMIEPACRLQTLVGGGGTGKTRLALKVAQSLLEDETLEEHFRDGIYFISMLPVNYPHQIFRVILDELNSPPHEQIATHEQIQSALRGKQILIVLDNFEHLIKEDDSNDSSRQVIVELLAKLSGLKLLITSRQALNLQEEWTFPIAGMDYSTAESSSEESNTSSLMNFNAIELFVRTAQRVKPSFSLEDNAVHIIKICQLVEGIPLAIELAAVRTRSKTCSVIAQEIEASINILSSSIRNIPPRHRSMQAVFEQSWQALNSDEQAILLNVSIFEGGFTEQAVLTILNIDSDKLLALVEKSLIQIKSDTRFRIHNLLRQFILDKLNTIPQQMEDICTTHSQYYLRFLQDNNPTQDGHHQPETMQILNREIGNIRVAWQYAIHNRDIELITKSHQSLYELLSLSSRFEEGERSFRQAVTMLESSQANEGIIQKLRIYQGIFSASLGNYVVAHQLLQQSVAYASTLRADSELVFSLDWLGKVTDIQGGTQEAESLYKQSLKISEAIDDKRGIASSLYNLGWIAIRHGDYETAQERFDQSLNLYREIGHTSGTAHALDGLGMSTFFKGHYATAESHFIASYDKFDILGDRHGIARAVAGKGLVALGMGGIHLTTAADLLQESLDINREISSQIEVIRRLTFLGIVANESHKYADAVDYLREALTSSKEIGFSFGIPWALAGLGWAMTGLGDFKRAQAYLRESIDIAYNDNEVPIILDTLVSIAYYGQVNPDIDSLYETSALLTFVQQHQSAWQVSKDRASKLLEQSALVETGQPLTFEAIMNRILPTIGL